MTNSARVHKIEMLVHNWQRVRFQALLDELEVSPVTLKRDLAYVKERRAAPIEYERFLSGSRFGKEHGSQIHQMPRTGQTDAKALP